jgi:hypothetical protein
MPIDPNRRCKCHGEPMVYKPGKSYECLIKRRERVTRYQQTMKGSAAKKRAAAAYNPRRVHIGAAHLYTAPTVSEARAVNAHIKGRRLEFKQRQQGRAEAEGAAAGAVRAKTAA